MNIQINDAYWDDIEKIEGGLDDVFSKIFPSSDSEYGATPKETSLPVDYLFKDVDEKTVAPQYRQGHPFFIWCEDNVDWIEEQCNKELQKRGAKVQLKVWSRDTWYWRHPVHQNQVYMAKHHIAYGVDWEPYTGTEDIELLDI